MVSTHLKLRLAAIVCFCIGIDSTFVLSYDHDPSMRPSNPASLVGQEIILCCHGLVPHGDTIEPRDTSFTCPNSHSLMSEPYTNETDNICINVTIASIQQQGMCECTYGNLNASELLIVDEPPSIAKENISCIFDFQEDHFSCSWPPHHFNHPEQSTVELLYKEFNICISDVSVVLCQSNPPCVIKKISSFLCDFYNISLRMIYNTTQGSIAFVSPWKLFYIPSIIKYPQLPIEVKEKNETCITLSWTLEERFSSSDVIQFDYESQWDTSEGKTSINITIEWPEFQDLLDPFGTDGTSFSNMPPISLDEEMEKDLCGLTPFTQYKMKVRIRPFESHLWSDAFLIDERTSASEPATSPPTISGAFKRIPGNKAIIYWKPLSEKEWQSDPVTMERAYHLFVLNVSSDQWQYLRPLDWNASQTEIHLLEEQDTVIKLRAHNQIGYAENFSSKITIPLKGIPAPTNLNAVIDENEKKVSMSWNSEYNDEVVLFWCLWENEYKCLQNTLDWRRKKEVSNKSAIVHIEDLKPSSNYMFGVSVSHQNIYSGIEWTCFTHGNGDKTSMVVILVSTFTVLVVIVVVLAIVWWVRSRWKNKSKDLNKPSSNLHRAMSDLNIMFGERNEHPPLENLPDRNVENGNGNDQSSESSNGDTVRSSYHRIGIQTSFTTINENDITSRNENSEQDESSGNLSDFSGNSASNSASTEGPYHNTETLSIDQDENNNGNEDSGTASHSEFWNSRIDQVRQISADEEDDSSEDPHFPKGKTTAEEDEDRGDVSH